MYKYIVYMYMYVCMYVCTYIIFLPILLLLKCSSRRVAFVHSDVDMRAAFRSSIVLLCRSRTARGQCEPVCIREYMYVCMCVRLMYVCMDMRAALRSCTVLLCKSSTARGQWEPECMCEYMYIYMFFVCASYVCMYVCMSCIQVIYSVVVQV